MTKTTLGNAIRAAVDERDKAENQDTSLPDSSEARKPENQKTTEEMVNLSVKVSRQQRIHWVVQAKRQGTSLTAVVIEALNNRFGQAPEE